MSPSTVAAYSGILVASIASITAITVSLVNGLIAKKSAQFSAKASEASRLASEASKANSEKIIHMVDGTQTAILEELKKLTAQNAGLAGEIRGRDFTREQMEARQDKLASGNAGEVK